MIGVMLLGTNVNPQSNLQYFILDCVIDFDSIINALSKLLLVIFYACIHNNLDTTLRANTRTYR